MSLSVVQYCQRIGRRARGGDFTRLSMSEQGDVLEAGNAALQRLYNALPSYFKELTEGFILPAPVALTGIGVTQFSKVVTGVAFTTAQFGQTVILDGDPAWNQIIGTAELLNPYNGATATVNGTVYGNAIYSTVYPFDRVIGNPKFADESLTPLVRTDLSRGTGTDGSWLFRQAIGQPQAWWPQVFGNSQGKSPIMVLRFAPAPEMAYTINVKLSFWPKRLTLADVDAAVTLPVPDQFIEKSLIPMAIQELIPMPCWQSRKDEQLVIARGDAGEAFARNQLGQIGSPNNRVYTPVGF